MTTALAPVPASTALAVGNNLTNEQIDLLKRTICKGATDDEFSLFVSTAKRLGLDPFARQIHAVKRWDSKQRVEVMAIQVGIDGFRVAAGRTGELDGQEGPFWCGENGEWRDVWLDTKKAPSACKVLVYRKGCARPFVGVATYASYVQRNKEGNPNAMWARGADFMLAKCAEAVALRKAFPERLSGVYTSEELAADDREPTPSAPAVGPVPPQSSHVAPTRPAIEAPKSDTQKTEPPKSGSSPTSGAGLPPEEEKALGEMIGKTKTVVELRKLANVLNKARPSMSKDQYERLLAAYNEQEGFLEDAAAHEAAQ